MKKITFLAMVHLPTDERIWFHQRPSLIENDCEVSIISAINTKHVDDSVYVFDGQSYSAFSKIRKASELLFKIEPDIIICDTPLAVFAAKHYQKKRNCRILYDVTEWYPSKKNLVGLFGIKRFAKKTLLHVANHLAGHLVNGFIFGEHLKSIPFLKRHPQKAHVFTSYYPDLQYIKNKPAHEISNICNLFYAGNLTAEKGFLSTLNVAILAAKKCTETNFTLKIITKSPETIQQTLPSNLTIVMMPFMAFEDFCSEITKSDLFLDLRTNDRENTQCLPIKLFYYLACGRPSIITDLNAIRIDAPDCTTCCQLVNPQDTEVIARAIESYIKNPELYLKHSKVARELSETQYNWGNLKNGFVDFLINLPMK